jgi:hypothetical protein
MGQSVITWACAQTKHLNATNVQIRSDAPDRQKQNAAVGGKKIVGEFSPFSMKGSGLTSPRIK